jgi:hypothetical protein
MPFFGLPPLPGDPGQRGRGRPSQPARTNGLPLPWSMPPASGASRKARTGLSTWNTTAAQEFCQALLSVLSGHPLKKPWAGGLITARYPQNTKKERENNEGSEHSPVSTATRAARCAAFSNTGIYFLPENCRPSLKLTGGRRMSVRWRSGGAQGWRALMVSCGCYVSICTTIRVRAFYARHSSSHQSSRRRRAANSWGRSNQ